MSKIVYYTLKVLKYISLIYFWGCVIGGSIYWILYIIDRLTMDLGV